MWIRTCKTMLAALAVSLVAACGGGAIGSIVYGDGRAACGTIEKCHQQWLIAIRFGAGGRTHREADAAWRVVGDFRVDDLAGEARASPCDRYVVAAAAFLMLDFHIIGLAGGQVDGGGFL